MAEGGGLPNCYGILRTGAFPLQFHDQWGDATPCRGADYVALILEEDRSRGGVGGGVLSQFVNHKQGRLADTGFVAQVRFVVCRIWVHVNFPGYRPFPGLAKKGCPHRGEVVGSALLRANPGARRPPVPTGPEVRHDLAPADRYHCRRRDGWCFCCQTPPFLPWQRHCFDRSMLVIHLLRAMRNRNQMTPLRRPAPRRAICGPCRCMPR